MTVEEWMKYSVRARRGKEACQMDQNPESRQETP